MKKFLIIFIITILIFFLEVENNSIVFGYEFPDKVRVLKNKDGTLSIIHPAPNSRQSYETKEEWLTRVFTEATPEGVEFIDINFSELPKDRLYRNAWEWCKVKNKIKINLIKAKQIIAEKLIAERMELILKKQLRQQAINELEGEKKMEEEK